LLSVVARYIPAMNKARIFLLVVIAACLLGGVLVGGFIGRRFPLSGGRAYNTATLLKEVQSLSELVTVKYVIEKVVVLEDVKWYGENRVLLLAHGVVKGGVDLGRLEPEDITISGDRISIKLPPTQVIDAYLDEEKTQVIERTTGLLRAFDKDLEQTARQNAVDDIRRAARVGGLKEEADTRAKEQLKALFRQLGFVEVEFR
jgi:hypothetical protein